MNYTEAQRALRNREKINIHLPDGNRFRVLRIQKRKDLLEICYKDPTRGELDIFPTIADGESFLMPDYTGQG